MASFSFSTNRNQLLELPREGANGEAYLLVSLAYRHKIRSFLDSVVQVASTMRTLASGNQRQQGSTKMTSTLGPGLEASMWRT